MSRSELRRRTPLERRARLRARTHSPEKRLWARLRKDVYRRDGGCCVACGGFLMVGRWECHHRKFLSRGGPRYAMCNLIALCFGCHHDRVHRATGRAKVAAEANGWALSPTADPALVPVLYHDGQRRLLDGKEAA